MAVGSFPHQQPDEAMEMIMKYFSGVPLWPQLPMTHPGEQMYIQFCDGIPGITLDAEKEKLTAAPVDDDFFEAMAEAMEQVMNGNLEHFALPRDKARGFYHFLESSSRVAGEKPLLVKGQVTGPVSFCLMVTDSQLKPILYDESYRESVVEVLAMKGAWQLETLRKIHGDVIIFIDEPYLASIGSSMVAMEAEEGVEMIKRVMAGIRDRGGYTGIHCCGNTDWGILMGARCDVLSFDAYGYGDNLLLYPGEIKSFLSDGGVLAWGIVPTSDDVEEETPESLSTRLRELLKKLTNRGIPYDTLVEQAFITPSCGLGNLSVQRAEKVAQLTQEVSRIIREEP